MLEIENEKFENERREKDQKISVLENQASGLNEKLLILKMDFEEKRTQGQETEGRLKEKLKDLSEELLALQKKRNQIFIEGLKGDAQFRRSSIEKFNQRQKSKRNGDKDTELNADKSVNSEVSINIIKVDSEDRAKKVELSSKSSISKANKKNEQRDNNGFGSSGKFEEKNENLNVTLKKKYNKK